MSTRNLTTLLLAVALWFAPFAHGCVEDGKWFVLDALLAGAFVSYLVGRLSRQSPLVIPRMVLIPIALLALLGTAQVLNPHYTYDPSTQGLRSLPGFRPELPWTMDRRTSLIALTHWASLALAFIAMVDLIRKRETRWQLLGAMALCGAAMSVMAILIKIQGGLVVPFTQTRSGTFFGTFVYHAHAAAFLNLCWPAALVLAIRSQRGERPLIRTVGVNAFLLIFLALFMNISKFGHLAALPSVVFALILLRKGMPSSLKKLPFQVKLVVAALLTISAILLLVPLLGPSIGRWNHVIESGFGNRPVLFGISAAIIRQFPIWGTGAGTFSLVVPYFTASLDSSFYGRLTHAHQDYLETLVEWGTIGFVCWLLLVGGGFLRGIRNYLHRPSELTTGASLLALSILGIHSLVDFPLQTGSLRLYAAVYLASLWRVRSPDKSDQKDDDEAVGRRGN
jgi:O-antigen ligase